MWLVSLSYSQFFRVFYLMKRSEIKLDVWKIDKSTASNLALSLKYNVPKKTVIKKKNRNNFEYKSSRTQTIKDALNELEKLIAAQLRALTWWDLDILLRL